MSRGPKFLSAALKAFKNEIKVKGTILEDHCNLS